MTVPEFLNGTQLTIDDITTLGPHLASWPKLHEFLQTGVGIDTVKKLMLIEVQSEGCREDIVSRLHGRLNRMRAQQEKGQMEFQDVREDD